MADILKFLIYGVAAAIILLFVGNRRIRKAVVTFAPVAKVLETRRMKKAQKWMAERRKAIKKAPSHQSKAEAPRGQQSWRERRKQQRVKKKASKAGTRLRKRQDKASATRSRMGF